MVLTESKKTGRCPSCNYPDEELFVVSGPDAEVSEMCWECVHELERWDMLHYCKHCGGYVADERAVGAQEFCNSRCEAEYQRLNGQGQLFIETAFGLAVAV